MKHQKTPRRRVPHLSGSARSAMIEKIKAELPVVTEMSLRQKLDALESFLNSHPCVSETVACAAAEVRLSTYCNHRNRNKRGKTKGAERRRLALMVISMYHPDKERIVIMGRILQELKRFDIHLGINTLRNLLSANGYKTHSINQSI